MLLSSKQTLSSKPFEISKKIQRIDYLDMVSHGDSSALFFNDKDHPFSPGNLTFYSHYHLEGINLTDSAPVVLTSCSTAQITLSNFNNNN